MTSTIRDLRLNADGDLDLEGGKGVHFVSGSDAIAQQLRIRLRMLRGEWALDQDLGVDYAGQVLGAQRTVAGIEAELKRAILGVPGVDRLVSFRVEVNGGTATVVFSATTDEGELLEDVVVAVEV